LRDALEQLDGPVTNLAAVRGLMLTRWSEVVDGRENPDLSRYPTRFTHLQFLALFQ
jgi:hypothetical protein